MAWNNAIRLVAGLALLVLFCCGCNEEEPPVPDTLPDMVRHDLPVTDSPVPDQPAPDLPLPDMPVPDIAPASRLTDHSVNAASASISAGVITLMTKVQTNAPGSFNGSGTGNKAIMGVWGYDKLKLGSLPEIKTVSKIVTGTHHFYFNFLVDLACDGSEPKVFVRDGLSAGSNSFDITKDWFLVVNGLDGKNTPPWATNQISFSTVNGSYPKACLVDSVSKDGGMPKGVKLRSVLLVVGGSTHNLESTVEISSLTIGGTLIK